MAAVTFLNPGLRDKIRISVPAGRNATLLELAREQDVPLRCRCKKGICGTCAVKVVPLRAEAAPRQVRLSWQEKALLLRAGKLSQSQFDNEALADMPPLWRLACQFQVPDEDILVAF